MENGIYVDKKGESRTPSPSTKERIKSNVQIELEKVDLENREITGDMKTKAGTNRTVPIHPRIRPLVIKWYNKAQELNSEYLFNCTDTSTARSNLMLTYDKYRRRIEALVDALELNPDHRPHDGRNTFITMCKNAGVDEYAIKTMVGHEIYDITEKSILSVTTMVA